MDRPYQIVCRSDWLPRYQRHWCRQRVEQQSPSHALDRIGKILAKRQLARVLGTRWISGREVGQPQISRNWRINGAAAPFSRIDREPANCDVPDTLAGGIR